MKRLLSLLLAILLSGCVTELLDEKLPGAYGQPPAQTHDVYRVGVIGCDRVFYTVIAVEVPFSGRNGGPGWYIVPLDVDLRPYCH